MSISSVVSLCCHVPLRPCGMTAGLECSSCGRVYNPTADALRASLAAAEAALADERKHADELAAGLSAWNTQHVPLLTAHAARRQEEAR